MYNQKPQILFIFGIFILIKYFRQKLEYIILKLSNLSTEYFKQILKILLLFKFIFSNILFK